MRRAEAQKKPEVRAALRKPDVLLAVWTPTAGGMMPGLALARAVEQLKAAQAPKPGDASANTHPHDALGGPLAEAAKPYTYSYRKWGLVNNAGMWGVLPRMAPCVWV